MELLAYSRIELGLSQKEFWNLTPAIFDAFCQQKKSQDIKTDYRFGLIAALMRALWGGEKRVQPMDQFFWTSQQKKQQTSKARAVYDGLKELAEVTKARK